MSGPGVVAFLEGLRDAEDMPMHHAADIDQWLTEAGESPLRKHYVVLQNERYDIVCSCGAHFSKDPRTNDMVPDAITLWAQHYRSRL